MWAILLERALDGEYQIFPNNDNSVSERIMLKGIRHLATERPTKGVKNTMLLNELIKDEKRVNKIKSQFGNF